MALFVCSTAPDSLAAPSRGAARKKQNPSELRSGCSPPGSGFHLSVICSYRALAKSSCLSIKKQLRGESAEGVRRTIAETIFKTTAPAGEDPRSRSAYPRRSSSSVATATAIRMKFFVQSLDTLMAPPNSPPRAGVFVLGAGAGETTSEFVGAGGWSFCTGTADQLLAPVFTRLKYGSFVVIWPSNLVGNPSSSVKRTTCLPNPAKHDARVPFRQCR